MSEQLSVPPPPLLRGEQHGYMGRKSLRVVTARAFTSLEVLLHPTERWLWSIETNRLCRESNPDRWRGNLIEILLVWLGRIRDNSQPKLLCSATHIFVFFFREALQNKLSHILNWITLWSNYSCPNILFQYSSGSVNINRFSQFIQNYRKTNC